MEREMKMEIRCAKGRRLVVWRSGLLRWSVEGRSHIGCQDLADNLDMNLNENVNANRNLELNMNINMRQKGCKDKRQTCVFGNPEHFGRHHPEDRFSLHSCLLSHSRSAASSDEKLLPIK